jgi:hypothetical protein
MQWSRPSGSCTELKILYYAIASPESLAALQGILKVQRRSIRGKLLVEDCNIPPLRRSLKAIERLDGDIAHNSLLRRCYIHQLFVESSAGSMKTSDGFVNNTIQSISSRTRNSGNPNNLEDSRVSKRIMCEVYPQLEQKTDDYNNKLRFVKRMRKLGQRLHWIVERFGYGIIGLLPLAVDVPAVDSVLNISDSL